MSNPDFKEHRSTSVRIMRVCGVGIFVGWVVFIVGLLSFEGSMPPAALSTSDLTLFFVLATSALIPVIAGGCAMYSRVNSFFLALMVVASGGVLQDSGRVIADDGCEDDAELLYDDYCSDNKLMFAGALLTGAFGALEIITAVDLAADSMLYAPRALVESASSSPSTTPRGNPAAARTQARGARFGGGSVREVRGGGGGGAGGNRSVSVRSERGGVPIDLHENRENLVALFFMAVGWLTHICGFLLYVKTLGATDDLIGRGDEVDFTLVYMQVVAGVLAIGLTALVFVDDRVGLAGLASLALGVTYAGLGDSLAYFGDRINDATASECEEMRVSALVPPGTYRHMCVYPKAAFAGAFLYVIGSIYFVWWLARARDALSRTGISLQAAAAVAYIVGFGMYSENVPEPLKGDAFLLFLACFLGVLVPPAAYYVGFVRADEDRAVQALGVAMTVAVLAFGNALGTASALITNNAVQTQCKVAEQTDNPSVALVGYPAFCQAPPIILTTALIFLAMTILTVANMTPLPGAVEQHHQQGKTGKGKAGKGKKEKELKKTGK